MPACQHCELPPDRGSAWVCPKLGRLRSSGPGHFLGSQFVIFSVSSAFSNYLVGLSKSEKEEEEEKGKGKGRKKGLDTQREAHTVHFCSVGMIVTFLHESVLT